MRRLIFIITLFSTAFITDVAAQNGGLVPPRANLTQGIMTVPCMSFTAAENGSDGKFFHVSFERDESSLWMVKTAEPAADVDCVLYSNTEKLNLLSAAALDRVRIGVACVCLNFWQGSSSVDIFIGGFNSSDPADVAARGAVQTLLLTGMTASLGICQKAGRKLGGAALALARASLPSLATQISLSDYNC